jgi:hypothetical protein
MPAQKSGFAAFLPVSPPLTLRVFTCFVLKGQAQAGTLFKNESLGG